MPLITMLPVGVVATGQALPPTMKDLLTHFVMSTMSCITFELLEGIPIILFRGRVGGGVLKVDGRHLETQIYSPSFHFIFHFLFHLILHYWGNIPIYPTYPIYP